MSSILPGFEYDIFISYRHKDNKYDGWVTEFVANLKREVGATFKEDISIYFDSNPYDGLLETHSVDKSLEAKLKSIVFIPIISQTYCDPKSFAWQHEFCVFNKMAKEDSFGRDIRLSNGNVASRILPVKIHDLDYDDNSLLEAELEGPLRAIEFIYKSSGVNRPLRADDKREDNLNRLFYRDQINKVANAAKEITQGIRFPGKKDSGPALAKSKSDVAPNGNPQDSNRKSIAVLPFVNLDSESSQEYFGDGITENILVQLGSVNHLRVISRTSVMRYKNSTKSVPEIAAELGVQYILEGSAQSSGNKVRIHVQLVDAEKDHPVWSNVYFESREDVFAVQKSVSEVVARELKLVLSPPESRKPKVDAPVNPEANELFLKGRHAFNLWGVDGYRAATGYFKQAITKDPEFTLAYSYLASSYAARMSWNGDLAPEEGQRNVEKYLAEAWKRGPSDNDYLTKGVVAFYVGKDFKTAEALMLQAIEINPNNATSLYIYSNLLNMMGRIEDGAKTVNRAKSLDPMTVSCYYYESVSLYMLNRLNDALNNILESVRLYPSVLRLHDFLAKIYLTMNRNEDAVEVILPLLASSKVRPPSMVAWLAVAYSNLKKEDLVKPLIEELLERSEVDEKGVNIYLVYVFVARGDQAAALEWLEKAKETNDVDLIWREVDPLLKGLNAK